MDVLRLWQNQYNLTFQAGACRRACCRPSWLLHSSPCKDVFNNIYRSCRDKEVNEISVELVDEVYESSMLQHTRACRTQSYAGAAEGSARAGDLPSSISRAFNRNINNWKIDSKLCKGTLSKTYAVESRSREDIVREILGILEHYGYLYRRDQDTYMFLSNLLKDWWKSHFGFGFKPAAER